MRKEKLTCKRNVLFAVTILLFVLLIVVKVCFFNEFNTDDGDQADIALNLLQGRLALDFQGNYMDCNKYFFVQPPLYYVVLAFIYKIFGATYITSKLVSALFSMLLALAVSFYCYKFFKNIIGFLIVSLILFDPLLFSFTYFNRMDITATLFFTLSVLLFMTAEQNKSLKLKAISGIFSGLALITSYNCNWLIIAFFGYSVYQIFSLGLSKTYKSISAYLLPVLLITMPWYGSILLNDVKRSIFLKQIIGLTANIDGYNFPQIMRKILNPAADLYLTLFRHHSLFAVAAILVVVYCLSNIKDRLYPLILLTASIAMMFFNQRAAHYFIIIIPVCYILSGYAVTEFLGKNNLKPLFKRLVYLAILLAVLLGVFNVLSLVFKKSDIKLDARYFSYVIKQYTPDGSRIATDPVFVLAERGNREVVQAGLLIWKWFRKPYKDYEELVSKVVDADYILLTERQKKWGELPVDQSVEFQNLLNEKCTLMQVVDDKIHEPIWLYKINLKTK